MEDYLKSLRQHMNNYEEKVADLRVEQHRQEAAIRSIEKDLEAFRAETTQLNDHTERISKEAGSTLQLILNGQKTITKLLIDSSVLDKALELLKEEITKQTSLLEEKRIFYGERSSALHAQFDKYQEYYDSSIDSQYPEGFHDGESTLGVKIVDNDCSIQARMETAKAKYNDLRLEIQSAEEERLALENSYQSLSLEIEESQRVREALARRCSQFSEIDKLEFESLEEHLKAIQGEKAAELEYQSSLKNRIEQLKNLSQRVSCTSCGHTYVVKLEEKSEA